MEITLNKKNNTEGVIKIKLTEGDYQPHVEEKVKEYSRKANIKGFRAGKVPAGVVKRMFGKSILVDEINHVLSHKLSDYIKDNNLKLLGEPLPDLSKSAQIDWDNQKDFEFEYQIGMVEDFTYELSSKVKVQSYPIDVDKKVIEETVADVRKRFGATSNPEVSEAGDNLFGELTSKEGDFKKEYAFLELDKVEKKEQKQFIGVKKGDVIEFEISKLFKEDRDLALFLGKDEAEVKGLKGKYVLTLNELSRVTLAELNQDLFDRTFGPGVVTSEAAFQEKIKETIAENYQRETEHFLDHNIEDYFIKNTNINLPDDFLKTWLKATSKGEITDEVLTKEFDAYKRGLKWDLVKNRIAEDNKISAETEEVRAKAKEMILAQFGGPAIAEQLGDRLDPIVDNYLQNDNGQSFMRVFNQIRNEKILKHIKASITVQEKKVSVDEFKKIVAEHQH